MMMNSLAIILNGVSFQYPEHPKKLFDNLSISFRAHRYALVGDNGAGKSTLLNIILGQKLPTAGTVETQGHIVALSQHFEGDAEAHGAHLLAVQGKLEAFSRLEQGKALVEDLEVIGDDWSFLDDLSGMLAEVRLTLAHLYRPYISLSGGEQTKLRLLECLLAKPDFILLDEPTNNLDVQGRAFLYDFVRTWDKGLIVSSHDRELLRQMDGILDLTSVGHTYYGGNYDAFVAQKCIDMEARAHQAQACVDRLARTESQLKKRQVQHHKSEVKGKRIKKIHIQKKGRYDKLGLNAEKERSENTQGRIKRQTENKLLQLDEDIQEAKAKVPMKEKLKFDLSSTRISSTKKIIEMEKVSFGYPNSSLLLQDFDFTLRGPERVHLKGSNGTGKSTLAQLILGRLAPTKGSISLAEGKIAYLDQHCSALDHKATVLENFQKYNPGYLPTQAYFQLADFNFSNKNTQKIVGNLSGGERLRAFLACVLTCTPPPSLLILDEPTNHLDLNSTNYLESVLSAYEGPLLVISHDDDFVEALEMDKIVLLGE